MKTLKLLALLSLISAPARAAFAPVKLPAMAVMSAPLSVSAAAPLSSALKSVPLSPMLPSASLPSYKMPVAGPRALPGVWNELPLELPAEAAVPVPAHDRYDLDWSHLDHEIAEIAVPQPERGLGASAGIARAAESVAHAIAAVERALFVP